MTGVGRAALISAGAVATTFVVDRALKVGIEHALVEGEQMHGPFGIRLRRHTNHRGIAGSEQRGASNAALLPVAGALALGIAGAGMLLGRNRGVAGIGLQVGIGMVAGGMAANLFDRSTSAGVTDFLPSPLGTLNAADLALGAGLLLSGVAAVGVALR